MAAPERPGACRGVDPGARWNPAGGRLCLPLRRRSQPRLPFSNRIDSGGNAAAGAPRRTGCLASHFSPGPGLCGSRGAWPPPAHHFSHTGASVLVHRSRSLCLRRAAARLFSGPPRRCARRGPPRAGPAPGSRRSAERTGDRLPHAVRAEPVLRCPDRRGRQVRRCE